MYDMYPQAWAVGNDDRPDDAATRPRRRPRREHTVVPAVLVRSSAAGEARQPTG